MLQIQCSICAPLWNCLRSRRKHISAEVKGASILCILWQEVLLCRKSNNLMDVGQSHANGLRLNEWRQKWVEHGLQLDTMLLKAKTDGEMCRERKTMHRWSWSCHIKVSRVPAASYLLPVEPSASIASAMSVHCKYQSARYHLELNASISSIASGEASSTSASIRVSMTSMLE